MGDCGVLAVVLKRNDENLGAYTKVGLNTLNHRGEDAHGVSFYNPKTNLVETIKNMGLVRDSHIFDNPIHCVYAIGHTRYITSSTFCLENAQPIEIPLEGNKKAAIAHNGNLTNDKDVLRNELKIEQEGVSDTRVLGMLLGRSLRNENQVDSIREALSKVAGSYSITV